MKEPKTFGELSLHDKIYWVNTSTHSSSGIIKIEEDGDRRSNVLIELDNYKEEPISFPDGESTHEPKDCDTKYTTDKEQYRKWIKPFVLKQIAEKEKRIKEIQQEIYELQSDIPSE